MNVGTSPPDDGTDPIGPGAGPQLLDDGGEERKGAEDNRVSVHVAARTATRLEEAERELDRLRQRVAELEGEIADRDAALATQRRAHEIERALVEAGAIDVEAASLLVASMLGEPGDDDDDTGGAGTSVADIVEGLRSDRPYLFARSGSGSADGSPTGRWARSAPMAATSDSDAAMVAAAQDAAAHGDRRALLRYLRMRRGV